MSRQFKNGACSCWKQVDEKLSKEGAELAKAVSFTGHLFLELRTERIDDKRKPPRRIVASFCPFCGKRLKEPKP